jgi:SAM-dependent methyltransferase
MRARGWDVYGVELSETSAAHAREVLGLPVFVGPLEQLPQPAGSFDVVILWHVLEHFSSPGEALRRCHELLRPGGLLVVAVPNFASLQARVAGPEWFHLDVPRHYVHFGLPVLTRTLEGQGFRVDSVSHFGFEQNPYGWMQSLLNRAGFRRNLLYDLLKDRSARSETAPFRAHPLQCLLLLPALVLVVPISLLLFGLELVLRRGGTVEVYATRDGAP